MKSHLFACALLLGAASLAAQQTGPTNPYEGTSAPPPDDSITTRAAQKPSPAKPVAAQPVAPMPAAGAPAAKNNDAAPSDSADDGIVMLAPDSPSSSQPALSHRPAVSAAAAADPDGDIVHPRPLPAGALGEGTVIRARLLGRLSTAYSERGDVFRTRVVADVMRDGQVLIPAESEIDGELASVSTGHFGGHGSMILRPQTVILPNGSRYRMYAQLSETPGARTRVRAEGAVAPGSQARKDGIEYTAGVGVGMVAGAAVGGPVGALAGSLIGAGAITVHLLTDHPQATLEKGTVLVFTLTEQLNLEPVTAAGSE